MKLNQNTVKIAVIAALNSLIWAGCSGDIKRVIKPASTNLDPLPTPVAQTEASVDPMLQDQWTVAKLGLTEVWKAGSTGARRVTVAIVGTGVDYNHEDLRGNILVNATEAMIRKPGDVTPIDEVDNDQNGFVDDIVGYDAIDDDGLPLDRNGAGTAAAGVIGAVHDNGKGIRGINANVSLIPVRYIDGNGQAKLPDLVNALRYVAKVKPDVVFLHMANLDFGSTGRGEVAPTLAKAEKASLMEALAPFRLASIPVIVSAGNSGSDLGQVKSVIRELSQLENVLVVTSIDENDKRPFIANFGIEAVATAAPGEGVVTTLPGNRYGRESGTFMAAAHVTGAVALAIGKHYGRVNTQKLYAALLSEHGSTVLPEMEFESRGGNRLNVAKFLAVLDR